MRRLLMVLVAALIAAALLATGLEARTYRTSKFRTRHVMVSKHRVGTTRAMRVHRVARVHRVIRHRKMSMLRRHARVAMICHVVRRHRIALRPRAAMPAAGPKEPTVVNCPAPTVSVPPASVTCPAPQVNMQPSVGITVDNCNIYIVRENELWVVGKDDLCVKKKATLTPPSTTGPPAMQ